jgi:hypothetical protein
VRVQGVVLKNHRDVAVLRWNVVYHASPDRELARRDRLESGDHAQRRALPAARRTHQHDELAIGDIQIDAVHGDVAVSALVHFAHAFQRHLRHTASSPR